jgi:enamine deaminase RidA (YjgF/YER057c/UK114 family)
MKNSVLLLLIFTLSCSTEIEINNHVESLYDYDVEVRIKEMGIELGKPAQPKANYVSAVRSGNLVFLSGNGPIKADGTIITGKVGTDLTLNQGYEAARLTAINQLSVLKAEIGDLNKVEQVVKVFGLVNSDPTFKNHPDVINGFSDLMVEVFGKRGKHARAAVGTGSLPWNIACEVELIVQIQE